LADGLQASFEREALEVNIVGDGVAHDTHGEAFGQESELFGGL
jgi:hypothetical protein